MSFLLTDFDGFFFIMRTASVKRACRTLIRDENSMEIITSPTRRNTAPPRVATGEELVEPEVNLRKILTMGFSDREVSDINAVKKV